MALEYRYYGPERPTRYWGGASVMLGAPEGPTVAVANGAASAALAEGMYRIFVDGRSRVDFGDVANGDAGEIWPADWCEVHYLPEGSKIGVSAL